MLKTVHNVAGRTEPSGPGPNFVITITSGEVVFADNPFEVRGQPVSGVGERSTQALHSSIGSCLFQVRLDVNHELLAAEVSLALATRICALVRLG